MNITTFKDLRLQAGLSQQALADEAGISVALIGRYERGIAVNSRTSTLSKLARVLADRLECSPDDIIYALLRNPAPEECAAAKRVIPAKRKDQIP